MDMHSIRRFPEALHRLRMRVIHLLRRLCVSLKNNGRRIGYYVLVCVGLCAIARAAEIYRTDNAADEALLLPAVDAVDVLDAEGAQPEVLRPEAWKLLRGFSGQPAWREELGMWETHPAVDYACADGSVPCLCAGVVQTVGSSGVYGGFVEVESDGLRMRYASISPAEGLAPGEALEAGDTVGRMDASMPGEAEIGAHLHLELFMEGNAADFERFAGENAAVD